MSRDSQAEDHLCDIRVGAGLLGRWRLEPEGRLGHGMLWMLPHGESATVEVGVERIGLLALQAPPTRP